MRSANSGCVRSAAGRLPGFPLAGLIPATACLATAARAYPARALLPCVVLAVLAAGCGPTETRSSPEEILETVRIHDPSILGYVRADAGGVQALVNFVSGLRENAGMFPAASPFAHSLPLDMICRAARLAREGTHMTVLLLDPGTFGGGAALHFVPESGGSLLNELDSSPRFTRVGDSPPEFRMAEERSIENEILRVIDSVGSFESTGIQLDIPGRDLPRRFVIEENARGVIVLPSYDARRDVAAFLESTDYLSPWEEAGFVLDLDIRRLAVAYADLLRSVDRSIREIAARLDARAERKVPLSDGRILMSSSATVLGLLGGMDGVRYASRIPGSNERELRILASDGGGVHRFLKTLREEGPDMTGLIPGGFALQLNAEPSALVGLVRETMEFYSDVLEMEPHALDPLENACFRTFDFDAGRYLLYNGVSTGSLWTSCLSALAIEAEPAQLRERSREVWAAFARLRGREIADIDVPGTGFIRSYAVTPGPFKVESGTRGSYHLTAFRFDTDFMFGGGGDSDDGDKPGEFAARILRLAGIGAPPGADLPRSAHVFLRFSLLPLSEGVVPAFGMLLSLDIRGYGRVEDRELIVRFPGR